MSLITPRHRLLSGMAPPLLAVHVMLSGMAPLASSEVVIPQSPAAFKVTPERPVAREFEDDFLLLLATQVATRMVT